jgi:hypothetical protein
MMRLITSTIISFAITGCVGYGTWDCASCNDSSYDAFSRARYSCQYEQMVLGNDFDFDVYSCLDEKGWIPRPKYTIIDLIKGDVE